MISIIALFFGDGFLAELIADEAKMPKS